MQQESTPDVDRFFREVTEHFAFLERRTGDPTLSHILSLPTVSSLDVDPRFALEQLRSKTAEKAPTGAAEKSEAGERNPRAGGDQVEPSPPGEAGAAHEKAGSGLTESAEGNPDRGPGPAWYKVSKAAQTARCNTGTITRAVDEGKLRSNGLKGRARRVDAVDLARWMHTRGNRPEPVESDATVERKLERAARETRRSST